MNAGDHPNPVLTVEQIRMAKAALGWSNPVIAEKTGLHRNTLNRAENGDGKRSTLELLKHVFEAAGVEFIPANGGGPGVRMKAADRVDTRAEARAAAKATADAAEAAAGDASLWQDERKA